MSEEDQRKSPDARKKLDEVDYFEQYWRYCAAVRNWLVAFGVGGCVLLISERSGIFKGISSEMRADVVRLFVAGVIAQLAPALINKWIHWYIYWGNADEKFRTSCLYRVSDRVSTWFFLDIVADLFTCASYAVGAWKMFVSLPGSTN